ncbi:porin [Paraferrimonas sp. SM1919]|uniref:porin n=1 Tax=Paraferrimonas sp. SM1919 TaxID=2662263 RepID=UPI0013D8902A|nr:porin [Paraferrimonas sp. SM1919]
MKKSITALAVLSTFASANIMANEQDLKTQLEKQKQQLAELERRLEQTEQGLDATAAVVDSSNEGKTKGVSIGGYGELHYNNIQGKDAKIDFHRFVLFVGHEFNEKTRFFSEIEIEHSLAGDGAPGEVELEQAYVEHDVNDSLTAKAGLFLIPVGMLNETHEPPTFYGVERNNVEKYIIPTTWWEAGAAANFKLAPGLSLDGAATSGLYVDENFDIRGGRQKVAKATANDLAYTTRAQYTAINGLKLSATIQHQEDIRQGKGADVASAWLTEVHGVYTINNFTVKALYARWDIAGNEVKALGKDQQYGYFVEPSYKITSTVGVFARYAEWDNAVNNEFNSATKQSHFGINYWLHEDVVFKADYQVDSGHDIGGNVIDNKGFNLGVGYQF